MSKENEIELMSFTEDGQRWLQLVTQNGGGLKTLSN